MKIHSQKNFHKIFFTTYYLKYLYLFLNPGKMESTVPDCVSHPCTLNNTSQLFQVKKFPGRQLGSRKLHYNYKLEAG